MGRNLRSGKMEKLYICKHIFRTTQMSYIMDAYIDYTLDAACFNNVLFRRSDDMGLPQTSPPEKVAHIHLSEKVASKTRHFIQVHLV